MKWKIWLTFLVVFFSGAISGGVITMYVIRHHLFERFHHGPPMIDERIVGHLDQRLHLRPDQHDAILEIVREGRREIDRLRRPLMPGMRMVVENIANDIQKHLDPHQQETFREIFHRFREEQRERRDSPVDERSPNEGKYFHGEKERLREMDNFSGRGGRLHRLPRSVETQMDRRSEGQQNSGGFEGPSSPR